ncbi:hypothetical protein [Agromyces cerinus]|uniref:Uncharacterized protein n=1 Tax=Agromyces cerinus subsp. cerinus TaxID=232089 RepID=A0A1N6DI68_9MICO|nr:hypothetical protein [Agromyces cerinus]SIN70495.1 hypothetical protein SAMN05443544_0263 [Agromyces cerinus subsp. cerinus]
MRWQRLCGVLTAAAIATSVLVALPPTLGSAPEAAVAADARQFDPGNIMSDEIFYAPGTMSVAQVQAFLVAKVPSCRAGYVCLKDFRQNTTSQPARSEGCAAITGRTAETAASIIVRVSSACGINPKVLLVLLEKEQGLVSDTWPTTRQYRSATGYGCPDTADCDTTYYGFFNQVYHASWQFKKYRARPDGRGYIAGQWNTIAWNPNAACGSSRVFIQNQATAGLYLYTPYRPNAAALANLYGTGDGCSSYGNRNFWRMYTDWFGSTKGAPSTLVRSETGTDVFLLSAGVKHHVLATDYSEFLAVLGPRQLVSQAFLDSMPTGRLASLFVKNARTGEIALIQDGATHRFSSCALVAMWGDGCGDGYLTITDDIFTRFKVGSPMTKFAKDSTGVTRMIEGTTAYSLVGSASTAFNGGVRPYEARMQPAVLARYSNGRTLAAPNSFVKSATSSQVLYVDGRSRTYYLPDWTFAAEYGIPKTYTTVSDDVISGYSRAGDVGLLLSCGSTMYAASSGKLVRIASGDTGGLPFMTLEAETCALLPKSPAVVTGPLFMKAIGASAVYAVHDGRLRHITSPQQLIAQNGGTTPTLVNVAATTLQRYPKGTAALPIGGFVKFSDSGEVFLVNGWEIVHLPRWSLATEYRQPRTLTSVSADAREGYVRSAVALGTYAKCGPSNVYAVTGGGKRVVSQMALAGNAFTRLHPSICATIPDAGAPIGTPLFLSSGGSYRVAVAGGFAPISAAAMREANAGAVPAPLPVAADTLSVLPVRGAAPAPGTLVRASNSSAVVFVDGVAKHPLPNWGVAADLGIASRYSIVHPAEPALLAMESPALGVFVQCAGQTHVASQGVLRRVAPSLIAGFPVVALTPEACSTLTVGGADIVRDLYVKDAGTGAVYRPTAGKLIAIGATAPPSGASILVLDSRTIAGIPRG